MLGLGEATLGLVESMLGLVEATMDSWGPPTDQFRSFPFVPWPALGLKYVTRACDRCHHCHPEAADAAPVVLVIAQIKRRGEGRRRTPKLHAGKGGGEVWWTGVQTRNPLPFRPVVGGSFGVLRREFSYAQAPTLRTRRSLP